MEAASLIVANSLGEKNLEVTRSLVLIGATISIYVVIMPVFGTFLTLTLLYTFLCFNIFIFFY